MSPAELVYARSPAAVQTLLLNAHAFQIERHRYGTAYRAVVDRLLSQERWPRDQIRAYQDQRVSAIVRLAYSRSSYYRSVMHQRRLTPADIRGVDDLSKLPLLDKQTLRSRIREIMTEARPRRGWLKGHTSGTTGSPVDIWYDRATCILNNAVDRRQKIWGGMTYGDWIGLFLGRVVVPLRARRPPFWRVNYVHRQVWFSSFHLSEETLGAYVRDIQRRGLRFLEGYPSTMFILANYLLRRGETLPLAAVFTSSETLHRVQRDTIERAFGCPIFDFYALAERVVFATECEAHTGKHLAEDYGHTEVVDERGNPVSPGRAGYLVGTSLHNVATPMLRYRTSDISFVRPEACRCGRTLYRIADVATKAEDLVITPSGRLVSPSILTHPFKPYHEIRKSQIIQEEPGYVLVKLVPSAEFTAEKERGLLAALQERLGSEIQIEIRRVDDLEPEPSGKFRWVVSRVPSPYAVPWEQVER